MKQLCSLLLIACCAFPIGMHAQSVSTDYQHGINFSDYHTYSISRVHTSDPLMETRLRDAINKALTAKGWQLVTSGADVEVTAVGARSNQQEYTSFYDGLGGLGWRRGWGGGGFGTTYTSVNQIPIGTLVVDLYEAKGKSLVWRGLARDTLTNNPEKNTNKLNKAVNKLFAKFPPKEAS
jgi:hypothetical protein